jgi:hypothetical protein
MKLPRRQFLHSGSGRCRAPGRVVDCVGTNLSDAAGALDRRLSPWWRGRRDRCGAF